jgi:hypothetical protein
MEYFKRILTACYEMDNKIEIEINSKEGDRIITRNIEKRKIASISKMKNIEKIVITFSIFDCRQLVIMNN